MRGGLYNTVFVIGVVLVGVIAIGGMIVFLRSGTIQTVASIKTDMIKLNTVDLAYVAEACLRGDGDFIPSEIFAELKGSDLQKVCSTGVKFGLKFEDLENPANTWDLGYGLYTNKSSPITSTVKVGDEIHLGRLYASF